MGKIITVVGDGGFNRRLPSNESGSGFIFEGGAAAPAGLAFGETSDPLTGLEQAEALGIDEDYDTDNDVLIWHHLKRFWHYSPNAKVWLILTAAAVSMEDMADSANPYLSKLIQDSEGEAKTIGLVVSPGVSSAAEPVAGIAPDVLAAIPKAQATAEAQAVNYRNVLVVLEGYALDGTAGAMDDLREMDAGNVVVTCLADPAVWENGASYENYAEVGTTVGIISRSPVHENGGWTEKYNLQDRAEGFFLTIGLSDGALAKTREAEYDQLTQKGVAFARTYPQQDGVYFEDSPTCAPLNSDFAYWTERRVMNKAIIAVYNALFPKINGPIRVDSETGKLDLEVVKSYEALGQSELDNMETNGEISGGQSFIDPDQDVITSGKLINKIRIVAVATGRIIEVQIGFTKQLG